MVLLVAAKNHTYRNTHINAKSRNQEEMQNQAKTQDIYNPKSNIWFQENGLLYVYVPLITRTHTYMWYMYINTHIHYHPYLQTHTYKMNP